MLLQLYKYSEVNLLELLRFMSADLVKVLTASLLICPIHTVPVPVTDIVGINAAVVRALKLSRMARTT